MSKSVKLGTKDVSVIGTFRLDVNRDKTKFRLTNINAFVPYGKSANDRVKFKTEAGEVDSIIIDKISTIYRPDENELDKFNVMVLLQHPDVFVKGLSDDEHRNLVRLNLKKPNPKFTLTNIDKVETDSFDNETSLIKSRAKLYSDTEPLSKEKLVWLCASFGLPYRTNITDQKRYKQQLIKIIDKYIQYSSDNRKKFDDSLDNIKTTEMKFYINELKNIGIITDIGGIYKVGDRPVGATDDHLVLFYEQNNEIYLLHQEEVRKSLSNTNII